MHVPEVVEPGGVFALAASVPMSADTVLGYSGRPSLRRNQIVVVTPECAGGQAIGDLRSACC